VVQYLHVLLSRVLLEMLPIINVVDTDVVLAIAYLFCTGRVIDENLLDLSFEVDD
jgi:hypothetical protein